MKKCLAVLLCLLPAAAILPPPEEATADLLYLHEELRLSAELIQAAAPPATARDVLLWGSTLAAAGEEADADAPADNLFAETPTFDAEDVYTTVPEVDAPIYTLIGVTAALARRRRAE